MIRKSNFCVISLLSFFKNNIRLFKNILKNNYRSKMAEEQPKPVLQTNDVTSFLDLQTEYIRRRDAAFAGKATSSVSSSNNLFSQVNKTKNNILAITREEKNKKIEIAAKRTQKIHQHEEALRKEEEDRRRQKQILEQKAKIYERMARGEKLIYEDGKEADFLVDFNTKKRERDEQRGKKKATKTYTDDDSTDEELKRSDEEQERFEPTPLVIHYDPTEEKGRVFGASHVQLPVLDEEAREKKIAELKAMTEQTKQERVKRKKQRNEQKIEERQRLNRLRERMGLSPVPLEGSDEEEEKNKEEQATSSGASVPLSEIPLPSEATGPIEDTSKKEEPKMKKPRYGVREWDRGKVGYMRWIEAQREEREEEFAPPSSYYDDRGRGKK